MIPVIFSALAMESVGKAAMKMVQEVRRQFKEIPGILEGQSKPDYENSISIEYLSRLNERYEAWIEKYDSSNLLIIEVDDIDFVENKSDFKLITEMIDKKLESIF
jgi:hypothetical protein